MIYDGYQKGKEKNTLLEVFKSCVESWKRENFSKNLKINNQERF